MIWRKSFAAVGTASCDATSCCAQARVAGATTALAATNRRNSRRFCESNGRFSVMSATSNEQKIQHKAQAEGDKPGVGIERIEEGGIGHLPARRDRRPKEAWHDGQHRDDERENCSWIEAARVRIAPVEFEQIHGRELAPANYPVVGDQNAAD